MKIKLKQIAPCLLALAALVTTSQTAKAVDYCGGAFGSEYAKEVCNKVCKTHGGWAGTWSAEVETAYPICRHDPEHQSVCSQWDCSVCGCKK